jgi:hypothetical protein
MSPIDSFPNEHQPIDVGGIHTNNESLNGKNKVFKPIMPERPVRVVLGPRNYAKTSKTSGNKTVPQDVNLRIDQQTRIALGDPDYIAKSVSKAGDNPESQYKIISIPMEPIPTSGVSIVSFRPSPNLFAPQRSH